MPADVDNTEGPPRVAPPSFDEVAAIIASLKNTAPGVDQISATMLTHGRAGGVGATAHHPAHHLDL